MCIPVLAGSQKPKVEIKQWQVRWGDSPVDSAGVPVWTYREQEDNYWNETQSPFRLSGRNKDHFLWVRIKSPDIVWDNPTLFMTNILYAAQIYVDTTRVYDFGSFAPDKNSRFNAAIWHMAPLGDNTEGKTIFLRIYSDDPASIGIPLIGDNKVFIGSQWAMIKYIITNSIDRFVLGCLFILIGMLTLDFFFNRWT